MKATIITDKQSISRSIKKMSSNAKRTALSLFHHMKQHGFAGGSVHIRHWENPVSAYLLKECILQAFPNARVDIRVDDTLPANPLLTDMVIAY